MGFGNILEAMPAGLTDGLDVNSEEDKPGMAPRF